MPTHDVYTLGTEDLEIIMNQVFGLTLDFLYNKDIIGADEYNDLQTNYAVILKKPTFFSRAWSILKGKGEKPHVIIVKQQTLIKPNGEEPEEKPKIKKEGSIITPDFKNRKDKEKE